MSRSIIIFSFALFVHTFCIAQNIAPTEAEIDKVFKSLKDASKPGVAAGLIKDGKIVYLKGFGSANMETGTAITTQTLFQLGELSKQFTTLAMLLLEEQRKISLNDDIRKYLTELPEYSHIVTTNHLINHSSGLHDLNRISNLINGNMNIPTQAKALKLIG